MLERSFREEIVMVGGGELPEQGRRVLDSVMRSLRDDPPNDGVLYRHLTRRIGRECSEMLDEVSWEALCVGYGFHLGPVPGDRREDDVQFIGFGSNGYVPVDLTQKYPRPTLPGDLPDAIADVWRALGRDESLHPALQARMADLMWARRDRSEDVHWFEVAVDAYVRMSDRHDWHIVERCCGLRRAIAIAAETRGTDLMNLCCSAAQRMIRDSLRQGDGQFGIVYPLLASLVSLDRDVGDLLDDAICVYREDPANQNRLLDLVAKARPEEAAGVIRRKIAAFEQRASRESGFLRLSWLREGLAVADQHGDREAVARLLAEIERVDVSEGVHTETFEEEIDAADIEGFSEQFAVGGGLLAELAAWSRYCPLEEESSALASAQAKINQYLHLQLVSQVVYDENGSVRDIHPGTEEQLRHVMHQDDCMGIQFFGGLFGSEALRNIIERNADELGDFETLIQCQWINEDEAERIGSALRRWHSGDLNQNDVRLLALCVESIIRTLLKTVGIRTTQLAPRGAPGTIEPLALGGLLNAWQDLPPVRARYFRLALLDLDGLRIRNSIGHAADHSMNTETALVVLIHILCFLGLNIRLLPEQQAV